MAKNTKATNPNILRDTPDHGGGNMDPGAQNKPIPVPKAGVNPDPFPCTTDPKGGIVERKG